MDEDIVMIVKAKKRIRIENIHKLFKFDDNTIPIVKFTKKITKEQSIIMSKSMMMVKHKSFTNIVYDVQT